MKKLGWIFVAAAVLLSDAMCAVVAYNYCDIIWGMQYAGYSAPPDVAFAYAIPFAIGIVICAVLAAVFFKKAKEK